MQDEELQRILRDLDTAKSEHQKALAELNHATKLHVDLGPGHADGLQVFTRAAAGLREVCERYREALTRFNDYCRKTAARSNRKNG